MDFRPARGEDAAAISALIHVFAGEFTVNRDGSGAERFFESISETAEAGYISDPRYSYILASAGPTLAGFIGVRDYRHVFHLFVAPEFQRRGLARRLWTAAMAEALTHADTTEFTVNSSPLAAPVYARFGFVEAGPRVEANGIVCVPMRLTVAKTGG